MSPRRGRTVAVALAAVLAVAGCGNDDTTDETTPPAPSTTEDATTDETTAPVPTTTEDDTATEPPAASPDELFPDVLAATAERSGDTWTVSATLSSPYDTPERYADAWRIVGPDGTVYGVRELAHDHQNEQPFTRSLSGVEIPDSVTVVTVEGRDQLSGWGGATVDVQLDRE